MPDLHGIQALFKLHPHAVKHILLFPARHAAPLARHAPVVEPADRAVRAPATVECHAFFNSGERVTLAGEDMTAAPAMAHWPTDSITLAVARSA
jgi:hypothetical protein